MFKKILNNFHIVILIFLIYIAPNMLFYRVCVVLISIKSLYSSKKGLHFGYLKINAN